MPAYTPASKSSNRIPQPAGNFSSLRIGHGLEISNSLNSKKPTAVVRQIWSVENVFIKGVTAKIITDPSQRFSNIEEWYIKTKRAFK